MWTKKKKKEDASQKEFPGSLIVRICNFTSEDGLLPWSRKLLISNVNDNINDLRKKCNASYLENKKYKDNNINILTNSNNALKEKTNKLEDYNINIIDNNNNKIMNEINKQSENIGKMNNSNIKNINEENNKSKVKIKDNEEVLKKFKVENDNTIKELSIKIIILENKLNKLAIQSEKIINNIIIKKKCFRFSNSG